MAPNKPFLNFIINISNKNVKLIHICNISTFIAKAENLKFAVFVSKFLSIDFISSVHLAIFWCDKLILEKSFFLSWQIMFTMLSMRCLINSSSVNDFDMFTGRFATTYLAFIYFSCNLKKKKKKL